MPMAMSIFQQRLSCALIARCWGIMRVNDPQVIQRRYLSKKTIQSTEPQRGTVREKKKNAITVHS